MGAFMDTPCGREGSGAFRRGRDRDRGGAFQYSRRGLRLRRRGAYSPVLTHGLRVVFASLKGQLLQLALR